MNVQSPVPPTQRMSVLEWLLLLTLSVLWGGSFFFAKIAVEALPPFTVVLGRVALAAIALNLAVIATGHRMPWSREAWGAFLVMGALNNLIPFSLIFWGQTEIASGLAAILNATTPLFTAILAHLLTREDRLTRARLLSIVLGFAGVIVLIGPNALGHLGVGVLAQIAVLGAALSYGFAGIFGRRFKSMGVKPLVAATGQVSATTILMLPIALSIDRPWMLPPPEIEIWAALFGLALLSTALAYVIFFRILSGAGAVNVSLVTLLVPVSAILLGTAILGERLETTAFLGMGLIAVGLIINDGRVLDRFGTGRGFNGRTSGPVANDRSAGPARRRWQRRTP